MLCDPMDCSLQGSSVHGILQASILEWVEFLSPGDLADPSIEPTSPALAVGFFTTEPPEVPTLLVSPNPILVTGTFLHCFLIHTPLFLTPLCSSHMLCAHLN